MLEIDEVLARFSVPNYESVKSFVEKNEILIGALVSVKIEADIVFNNHLLELQYIDKYDSLLLIIKTEYDALEALDKLAEFDAKFLQESAFDYRGLLDIAVEMNDSEDFFLSEEEAALYEEADDEEETYNEEEVTTSS